MGEPPVSAAEPHIARTFDNEYGMCSSSSEITESACSSMERLQKRGSLSPTFSHRSDKCSRCAIFIGTSVALVALVIAAVIAVRFTGMPFLFGDMVREMSDSCLTIFMVYVSFANKKAGHFKFMRKDDHACKNGLLH